MGQRSGALESVVDSLGFWKNKKVLLTGHTGFKGGWLALWLRLLGADVTGVALPAGKPSLFHEARIPEVLSSIHCDIRNFDSLVQIFRDFQPEIVIHMAAQSLVRYSYKHPLETLGTNVMGTANLLEAARLTESVRVCVNITSDKCYENKEWIWGYREKDPMGGHDPYSCSKGCSELLTSAYQRSFFQDSPLSLASARAGNVIGGGDWAEDRLIPDIIDALLNNRKVAIRNPQTIRPWQHVCEPLSGYLILAENLWNKGDVFAGGWNFGPHDDDVKPVAWITEYLCKKWTGSEGWFHDGEEQPYEASYLKLDCSKAGKYLKWKSRLDLHTALDWTLEWYAARENGEDMQVKTEEQIRRYQKRCGDA